MIQLGFDAWALHLPLIPKFLKKIVKKGCAKIGWPIFTDKNEGIQLSGAIFLQKNEGIQISGAILSRENWDIQISGAIFL